MPSASTLHSFPVPLGRRGTAAAVVIGLHVLLVVALVSGLARVVLPVSDLPPIEVVPMPRPASTPIPPTRAPAAERPGPSDRLVDDPPPLPRIVGPRSAPEAPWTGPAEEPAPTIAEPAPASATQPRVLRGTEPSYPAAARRMGYEGAVRLRVRVDALGRAEAVEIARSSGHSVLDAAAMAAVRRWQFAPAQSEGRAIAAWVTFTVTFRLTDR